MGKKGVLPGLFFADRQPDSPVTYGKGKSEKKRAVCGKDNEL